MSDMKHLLANVNPNAPAAHAAIIAAEKELDLSLPPEYKEFLILADGGEGFVGKEYLILWRIEELASLNRAYQVQDYVPGLLIFGSNGGGEALGFDTRKPGWPIVQVPFVGMEWNLAEPLGITFRAFLEHLQEGK